MLLLPLLAFGVDAGLTLGRRMLRGERWWEPHVQHAYQAQARRRGHGAVTAGYFAFTLAASALVVAGKDLPPAAMMVATGVAIVLACGAWWRMQADGPSRSRSRRGVEG